MKSDKVSMLQQIFGYTDFDAVEFSRWSETAEGRRKQIEVVKSLLPKDVQQRIDQIDVDVKNTKELRKDANAEVKTFTNLFDSSAKNLQPGDVQKYSKKIEIADLMQQQSDNAKLIEKAKTVREALQKRTEQLAEIPNREKEANDQYSNSIETAKQSSANAQIEFDRVVKEAEERLKKIKANDKKFVEDSKIKLDQTLEAIKADKQDFESRKLNAENWLKEYEENNPEKTDTADQLKKAEEHNNKNKNVVEYLDKKAQKEAAEKKAETHDNKITTLLKERETLIANSKLPIDGLTFTDEGLELNNVPFVAGKVSDSQIMEVATKLIIASNPNVKVFRIARGESLGEKRLQDIINIAQQNGFQGFIEEVKRGQDDLIVEEYTEGE